VYLDLLLVIACHGGKAKRKSHAEDNALSGSGSVPSWINRGLAGLQRRAVWTNMGMMWWHDGINMDPLDGLRGTKVDGISCGTSPLAALAVLYQAMCRWIQRGPLLEWHYWRAKTEVLGGKPVTVTLCAWRLNVTTIKSELHLNIESVPPSKHSLSVIRTSQLMLHREIIAVCSEIHIKHINTLCWQIVEILNVKLVVHIVTTGVYMTTYSDGDISENEAIFFVICYSENACVRACVCVCMYIYIYIYIYIYQFQ
jgi:hypothetical protein